MCLDLEIVIIKKQHPNTKRFKRTLIYYNTDTLWKTKYKKEITQSSNYCKTRGTRCCWRSVDERSSTAERLRTAPGLVCTSAVCATACAPAIASGWLGSGTRWDLAPSRRVAGLVACLSGLCGPRLRWGGRTIRWAYRPCLQSVSICNNNVTICNNNVTL